MDFTHEILDLMINITTYNYNYRGGSKNIIMFNKMYNISNDDTDNSDNKLKNIKPFFDNANDTLKKHYEFFQDFKMLDYKDNDDERKLLNIITVIFPIVNNMNFESQEDFKETFLKIVLKSNDDLNEYYV